MKKSRWFQRLFFINMTILYIIIHFTRFRRFSCFTGVTITNIATNWNNLVEKRKTETIRNVMNLRSGQNARLWVTENFAARVPFALE